MAKSTPADIVQHAADRLTIIAMRAHGARRADIAAEIGVSMEALRKRIQRLIQRGVLTRQPSGPPRGPRAGVAQ